MTDAEYESTKQRIVTLVDKWREALGLCWWQVTYIYYRDGIPNTGDSNFEVCGQATVNWQYQSATIEFGVQALQTKTDEQIEHVVVHEMMHVFLNEMREHGADRVKHEERVASTLTSAFLWVRDMFGKGEPKAVEEVKGETNTDGN